MHVYISKGTSILEGEYLLLYVDDMLLISKHRERIESMKKILRSEFEIKDLELVGKILRMSIERDKANGTVFLNQKG